MDDTTAGLEGLLDYLKRNRGFDFTAYKRSTLQRRIEKRMQVVGITEFTDYGDYLQVHPGEFAHLFNVILINVTEFFRDPPVWDYLATDVIPRIIGGKGPDEHIRVWSAGSSSGEEAYSAAIMFAEALDLEGLRTRVKIYATDVDEEALTTARVATYAAKGLESLSGDLLAKYFQPDGDGYSFNKDARRSVIFGRHDLIQDPPISRVDLLLCRNTLMYFNNETQAKILARFHFALANDGFLVAGRAEMLLTHGNMFVPVDLKRRVFTKVWKQALPDRVAVLAQANNADQRGGDPPDEEDQIRHAAFEHASTAQLMLDVRGMLLDANELARKLFRLNLRDGGRSIDDLGSAAWPPGIYQSVEQVYGTRQSISLKNIEWPNPNGDARRYNMQVIPLRGDVTDLVGVLVVLEDVSESYDFQQQLQRSRQELETVSEELQSSSEELETTNEELQSTVEELETTNEELQSTNEELETMNEELQSTNEELHTINDELQTRSETLNATNTFFESILESIGSGLVVLNRQYQVEEWNRGAEDLWGLRSEEVRGKVISGLDIGLPVDQLTQPIRQALAGERSTVTVKAINRRGKSIWCAVQCVPLQPPGKPIDGVLLSMNETQEDPAAGATQP